MVKDILWLLPLISGSLPPKHLLTHLQALPFTLHANQMGRATENHGQIHIDTYTRHVTTFLFLSLGLISLKGTHKTYFCSHKMSKESSLSQLSRLKSKFFNLSPPYSQSQNSYQILFFSFIIFPYPLISHPQHLSPPEVLLQ